MCIPTRSSTPPRSPAAARSLTKRNTFDRFPLDQLAATTPIAEPRQRADQLRARRPLLVRAEHQGAGGGGRAVHRLGARRRLPGRVAIDAGHQLPADGRGVLVGAHDGGDDQRARGHGGRAGRGVRRLLRPDPAGRRSAVHEAADRLRGGGAGSTGAATACRWCSARRSSASTSATTSARASACDVDAAGAWLHHVVVRRRRARPAPVLRDAGDDRAAARRGRRCRRWPATCWASSSPGGALPMILSFNPQRTFIEVADPDRDGYGQLDHLDAGSGAAGAAASLPDRRPRPAARRRRGQPTRCGAAACRFPRDLPARLLALQGREQERLPNGSHVAVYKDALYADHAVASARDRRLPGDRCRRADCTMHVQLAPQRSRRRRARAAAARRRCLRRLRPARLVFWPYHRFPFGMTVDYERKFTYYVPGEPEPPAA